VLVLINGNWVHRVFACRDSNTGKAFMVVEYETSSRDQLPGPFSLDRIRLPDILSGFIKEVDAGE
jgi:hypothetical protein